MNRPSAAAFGVGGPLTASQSPRILASHYDSAATPGTTPSIQHSRSCSPRWPSSTTIVASSYGGSHVWPVAASMCASLNPAVETSIVPSRIGSVKRRGPIEPGLKTVTPLSLPINGTCE